MIPTERSPSATKNTSPPSGQATSRRAVPPRRSTVSRRPPEGSPPLSGLTTWLDRSEEPAVGTVVGDRDADVLEQGPGVVGEEAAQALVVLPAQPPADVVLRVAGVGPAEHIECRRPPDLDLLVGLVPALRG